MTRFKSVVRGFGLLWVASLAIAVWQYAPLSNAVAAPSTSAAKPLVSDATVTTAGGPRVVYQGSIMGAPASPRPAVAAVAEAAPATPKTPYVWQDVPAQVAVVVPTAVASQVAVVKAVPPVVPVAFARLEAPKTEPRAAPVATVASRVVNLNTASVAELNRLGGGLIGRAIVAGRPYRSADDLLAKRVLNKVTFAQIKNQVGAQ